MKLLALALLVLYLATLALVVPMVVGRADGATFRYLPPRVTFPLVDEAPRLCSFPDRAYCTWPRERVR